VHISGSCFNRESMKFIPGFYVFGSSREDTRPVGHQVKTIHLIVICIATLCS
jgi:hypothetical protein